MKKKLRKFARSEATSRALSAFLTFCLIFEMLPAQSIAYAVEGAASAESAPIVEQAEPAEEAAPAEEVAAPAPDPEPAPEPEPEPEPVAEPEPEPVVEEATAEEAPSVAEEATTEEAPAAETSEPAAAATETATEPEVAYPAFSKDRWAGETHIVIEADEGVLPEGTDFDFTDVTDDAITAAVEAATEGDLVSAKALRVTFTRDGQEVKPKGEVRLRVENVAYEGETFSVLVMRDGSAAKLADTNIYTAEAGLQEFKLSAEDATRDFVIVANATPVEEPAEEVVPEEETTEPTEGEAEEPVAEDEATAEEEAATEETPAEAEPEETPAEPETPAVPMPAGGKSIRVNGVNVNVNVGENVLPQGWYFEAVPVVGSQLADVEGAVAEQQADAKVVAAFDITLYDAEGNVIQPAEGKSVSVTFRNAGAATDDVSVYHVTDDMVAEPVETTVATAAKQTFEAGSFSIYAVVETGTDARVLVKFVGLNNQVVDSMYVKENDDMDVVLYDPGVGQLEDGVYFRGWTTEKNYTTETPALSIAEVRTAVDAMLPPTTDGTEITYYAMLFKDYRITYLDENDISLGQEEVTFRADAASAEQSYTVNMGYTVQDDTHHFEGWNVREGGKYMRLR